MPPQLMCVRLWVALLRRADTLPHLFMCVRLWVALLQVCSSCPAGWYHPGHLEDPGTATPYWGIKCPGARDLLSLSLKRVNPTLKMWVRALPALEGAFEGAKQYEIWSGE